MPGKMHVKLLISLFLIVLMVGCSAEKPTAPAQTTTQSKVTVEQKTTTTQTETAKPAVSAPASLSTELRNLIAKSDDVESMEYSYSRLFPETRESLFMKVYIKGNKQKLEFAKPLGRGFPGEYHDTVYIDTSSKTIVGYCEESSSCTDEMDNVPVTLDYNDFVTLSPKSLIKSLRSGEIVGKERYDSRDCQLVEFTNSKGNKQKLWVWEYTGIPLKYEVRNSDGDLVEDVSYKQMNVNGLKDSDVVHS